MENGFLHGGNATPIIDVSRIIKNCANDRIDNAFHRIGLGTIVVNDVDDVAAFI